MVSVLYTHFANIVFNDLNAQGGKGHNLGNYLKLTN